VKVDGTFPTLAAFDGSGEAPGTIAMAADAEGTPRPVLARSKSTNPHLAKFCKLAGVGAAELAKFGPGEIRVLPNLRELVDATDRRGG